MAMGAAFHLWAFDAVTLSASFNEAAARAPVAGMTMGGVWFGLGAPPRSPLPAAERVGHRIQLLFLVLLTIGGVVAASVLFAAVPAMAVGLCAGIACAGYLSAGSRMIRAFRLLCLPHQMAAARGSVLFVPITLFLAAWGIPELSPALQQTTLLAIGSFPGVGFVLEHRKRPGLPTMVIALSIPGAIQTMRRGYRGPLLALLADVDYYEPSLRGYIDRVATCRCAPLRRWASSLGASGT